MKNSKKSKMTEKKDQHTDHEKQRHISRLIIIVIAVLIAAGFVVLAYRTKLMEMKGVPSISKPDKEATQDAQATIVLQTADQGSVYADGEEITILVIIDSKGSAVTGYDLVIAQLPEQLGFLKAESLVDGFEMHPVQQNARLSVTGVKAFGDATEYTFDSIPVAQLSFVAQGQGPASLDLKFEPGDTTDTNLVGTGTNDILGGAFGVDIRIGMSSLARPNNPITIDSKGTTFTLKSTEVPDAGCFDCPTTATAVVSRGQQSETVTFTLGGFEGTLVDSQDALGYTFETESISSAELQVRYAEIASDNDST